MRQASEQLRNDILARYKSIHAFCRIAGPELCRSTVYQLLAGKYPGDVEKQIRRIQTILSGTPEREAAAPALTASEAYTVLLDTKCAHCRKLDKGGCRDCRTQTLREAQAIEKYLLTRAREAL